MKYVLVSYIVMTLTIKTKVGRMAQWIREPVTLRSKPDGLSQSSGPTQKESNTGCPLTSTCMLWSIIGIHIQNKN